MQKHLLFMTLAAYDPSLDPVPRLAAWQWDTDRTLLTFTLRDDVRWHDGVLVTADDVAWTLAMARDPAVAYPRARDLRSIRSVTVVDPRTVRVRYASPQPTFPDVFTDLAILPAHAFAGHDATDLRSAAFNAEPTGSGPFRFVEHRTNDRWVFERRDDFPADLGAPPVERFVIAVVDEPSTKLAALTSGELDFAGIAPAHARFVEDDARLAVAEFPLLFVTGIFWNARRAPFADPRVRRALGLALDRRALVDGYVYGFGAPAGGPVPPEHPWHAPAVVDHDPASAERLLDAAGWARGADGMRARDGRALQFELLTVGSGDLALEQMVQAQWRAIGVVARIRALELSTFLAVAQAPTRDFDALLMGVPGDLALGYVGALFGDPDGPQDYTGVRSAAIEAAFVAVDAAANPGALQTGWGRVQDAVADAVPVAWVYHARGVQGVNRRVRGATPDLRGELANLAEWRVGPRP